MALRTFTDNLINLAIESCLVQDLPSLFTPRLVNNMDDGKLAEFAAESEGVLNYRSQLRKDIKLLKQGLEQCRRYKPRATERSESHTQSRLKLGMNTKNSISVEALTIPSSVQAVPRTPQKNALTQEGSKAASKPSNCRTRHVEIE